MLKGFALVFAAFSFAFCFYSLYSERSPVLKAYSDEYELYLSAGSFGNGIVYATDGTFGDYDGVKGESCDTSATYERVLKDFSAKHLFSETAADGTSYYAYSPKIPYRVYIKGAAVNIHYFKGKEKTRLGTPIIYGSF